MFCKKCGKEIHDEAVVCVHCGCAVEDNAKKNEGKSWLATLLLCIFPFIGKKDEMTRLNGIIFFGTYIVYMINLCLTAV